MALSDAAGVLFIDFSNPVNGVKETQFTSPAAGYSCAPNVSEVHAAVAFRYYRIRYVNGPAPQSYFSLAVQELNLGGSLNVNLNDAVNIAADCSLTRPTEAQDDISLGLRDGVIQLPVFAHRAVLDVSDGLALVSSDSTTNVPWLPVAPSTLTIAYNPATDGAAGGANGAKTIDFHYLNAEGLEVFAVHTLGSSGSDVTAFTTLGINRCEVASSGSSGFNVNAITVTATTGGQVATYVEPASSVAHQAVAYIPNNSRAVVKTLLLNVLRLANGSAPKVLLIGYVWNRLTATRREAFRYEMDTGIENYMPFLDSANFPLRESDVLYFMVQTDVNGTTIGAVRFSANVYQKA
tara:strand:+ start:733 stop:1782 length:1050 start_codon:yes stop_codon:yes gene_type:complete